MQDRLQAALGDLLALPLGQRARQQGVCPGGIVEVGGEAALLAQLAKRVAAPRRLEQVGAEQRVVADLRRDEAQRLDVMGHHGTITARAHEILGRSALADEHLIAARHSEAPRGIGREQLALGHLRRADGHDHLLLSQRGHVGQRRLALARRQGLLGLGRGRRRVGVAQRLLEAPQRVAQLELPEDVAQARAVGLACGLLQRVEAGVDVALHRGQLLGHAGVLGVLEEVLLALGAGDLIDGPQHLLQGAELLQQRRGGLVADPGNARDVVGGVALEAVEVGDQLGGDPVAVDHRLAVIDLRLGDAAAGGHDLHQARLVDELERRRGRR